MWYIVKEVCRGECYSLYAVFRWSVTLVKFISVIKFVLTAGVGEIWDRVRWHVHVTGWSHTAARGGGTTPCRPQSKAKVWTKCVSAKQSHQSLNSKCFQTHCLTLLYFQLKLHNIWKVPYFFNSAMYKQLNEQSFLCFVIKFLKIYGQIKLHMLICLGYIHCKVFWLCTYKYTTKMYAFISTLLGTDRKSVV